MSSQARFKEAYPFQKDVLALPVANLDAAARWYAEHFGMTEVERIDHPVPTVILERDGTRIGFAMNGGDSSQDGAAVLVSNIRGIKDELEANGTTVANWRVDERDGQKYQVFFVVAPDGLCYYFHEPCVSAASQTAHLDHLTIFVRDADRSRDWFMSVLGLKVEFEVASPRAIALQDAGGFGLFVEQRPAGECTPSCVITFRVEDVDALVDSLLTARVAVTTTPQKLFWGYGAELRDPDGYLVRLWDETSMRDKGGT